MKKKITYFSSLLLLLTSCHFFQKKEQTTETVLVKAPIFNADSAFSFLEKQVKFGPRVPNSTAHKQCGDYLVSSFKQYGCAVTEQNFTAQTFDNKTIQGRNIIGSFNPDATKRIILAAHWDSRPFADKDTKNQNQAIDAANDGASGVGVLLEIARNLQNANPKPNVGVDFILFDAEDWGEKDGESNNADPNKVWWCLGSQYWAKNPHKAGYNAYYGILLDMVGAKGATFPKEGLSMQYAGSIANNVWSIAEQLGYSQQFQQTEGGSITDDHYFVNTDAKIPMVDIIDLRNGGFFEHHHTNGDTIDKIDKNTLKAVGQTLIQVLYQE